MRALIRDLMWIGAATLFALSLIDMLAYGRFAISTLGIAW